MTPEFQKQHEFRDEVTLSEVIQIIIKKKLVLFGSIILFVAAAVLYSFLTPEVYEGGTMIKKENTLNDRYADQFKSILLLQSLDELETEMEIAKSRTILEKVVSDLNYHFKIEEIIQPFQKSLQVHTFLADFQENGQIQFPGANLPNIHGVEFQLPYSTGEFYLKVEDSGDLGLYQTDEERLLSTYKKAPLYEIELPNFKFGLHWLGAKVGSELRFSVMNYDLAIEAMRKSINVHQVKKTNIFRLTIQASSPTQVKMLANRISEIYIQSRIEQKKQTIHYSFNFVDDQLSEITGKLKDTESELSDFKSANKLISLNDNSRKIIDFLGNLEAEHVKTELELSDYENKYKELKSEMENKGYFDQTYLTPNQNQYNQSPFAVLLRQISDAEINRLELMQKRTANHPDVIAVDDKIRQLQEKLSSYNENTILAYQILIGSMRKKIENLNGLIQKYADQIEKLPSQETRLAELTRRKNSFEKIYSLLLDKREEMRMAELSQLQDIVIIDPATAPLKPILPKKRVNVVIGFGLGLIIGLIAVFISYFQGNKVADLDEIEKGMGLQILSVIPRYDGKLRKKIAQAKLPENRLVNLMEDQIIFREAFRHLRTKLINIFPSTMKTMLITSSEENAGKSTVITNFAISLARLNKKVLIIDADLKKSRMAHSFNLGRNIYGLSDYLMRDIKLPLFHPFEGSGNHEYKVDLIPAGRYLENSSEALGSKKMQLLIQAAEQKYDYVLVDTPPMISIVDTLVLGRYIKNLILIVRPQHSYRQSISWALQEIEQVSMRLMGVVVNAYDVSSGGYKYKYRYGYGYGVENAPQKSKKAEAV